MSGMNDKAWFEENLSAWVNGQLSESDSQLMQAATQANPEFQSMLEFEKIIRRSLSMQQLPERSIEAGWQELRPLLKLNQPQQSTVWSERFKHWLGFEPAANPRGWQIGFAMAVVCFVQLGLLIKLQFGQDQGLDNYRSVNKTALTTHKVATVKPLPSTTVQEFSAQLRPLGLQILSGPNANAEFVVGTDLPNPPDVKSLGQKLSDSGLFEYVQSDATHTQR